MITDKLSFMFPWQPLLGKHIFSSKKYRLIIEKLNEKNVVKQLDSAKEKLPQICTLYPVAKDPDLSIKVKIQQKKFFWCFTKQCMLL